jgi:hypothetical protein
MIAATPHAADRVPPAASPHRPHRDPAAVRFMGLAWPCGSAHGGRRGEDTGTHTVRDRCRRESCARCSESPGWANPRCSFQDPRTARRLDRGRCPPAGLHTPSDTWLTSSAHPMGGGTRPVGRHGARPRRVGRPGDLQPAAPPVEWSSVDRVGVNTDLRARSAGEISFRAAHRRRAHCPSPDGR